MARGAVGARAGRAPGEQTGDGDEDDRREQASAVTSARARRPRACSRVPRHRPCSRRPPWDGLFPTDTSHPGRPRPGGGPRRRRHARGEHQPTDRVGPTCRPLADCASDFGLCCVAPAFRKTTDFPFEKPASAPFRSLNEYGGCRIHPQLRDGGSAAARCSTASAPVRRLGGGRSPGGRGGTVPRRARRCSRRSRSRVACESCSGTSTTRSRWPRTATSMSTRATMAAPTPQTQTPTESLPPSNTSSDSLTAPPTNWPLFNDAEFDVAPALGAVE